MMMKKASLFLLLSICLIQSTEASVSKQHRQQQKESGDHPVHNNNNDEKKTDGWSSTKPCRLWLAPSHLSTEERPRFGVFAGVEFSPNETLPHPEVGLPLVDFVRGLHDEFHSINKQLFDFMETKLWFGGYGGVTFEGNHSSFSFIPGVASLANYHAGIRNVEIVQASVHFRQRSNDGIADPGRPHPSRGNISPFHNITLRALQRIPAGMEIFPNFGDAFDTNANDEDIYEERITREDYHNADKILDKILNFMDHFQDQMSPEFQDDVLDFMLENVLDLAGGGRSAKAIRALIPAHPRKLHKVRDMGGTFAYRNRDMIKTQAWLEDRGLCMDNLQSGISTIPDAGRGAFANRPMKEGSVIAPIPMMPIVNENILRMYEIDEEEVKGANQLVLSYNKQKRLPKQLLINYCFAHRESSLLLVPQSSMVGLINHASLPPSDDNADNEDGKPYANAVLSWSKHRDVFNDHSLHDVALDDWNMNEPLTITMTLIALRDIEEGEEIFLDYGRSWANAWEQYKEEWIQYNAANPKWPLKAEDIRPMYKNKPYPVNLKLHQMPYPEGVITVCFVEQGDVDDGEPYINAEGGDIKKWIGPTSWYDYSSDNMFICDLQDRRESEEHMYVYTVHIGQVKRNKPSVLEVTGVPHAAITLLDKSYTSDIHHHDHPTLAFRRWIEIEDQRFPQAWRNLR